MAKYIFDHDKLRLAISLAKIIKPENGDYCFSFTSNILTIFSFDRRRYVCSRVSAKNIDEVDTSFKSNDYYINTSRLSLFDSDLTSITVSVNDQSMSISCSGDSQKRNVNLKRKNSKSKRPQIPLTPSYESISINSKDFEQLLTQVSCSALIKETKTVEEMRINQVHFYPGEDYACSSARYYGTVVYLSGIGLNLSIVASDIPALKRFCSEVISDSVDICQDKYHLYIIDKISGSFLAVSRVAGEKPPLSVLNQDGFKILIIVDHIQLLKNLEWAELAIEGTQRITFKANKINDSYNNGLISLYSGSSELSSFPAHFLKGDNMIADFPVSYFSSIVKYIEGPVSLGFNHDESNTVLGVFAHENSGNVKYSHYLQSMKSR